MLKSQIKLTGTPEGKDSMVLPLFTDWDSLRKWKGISKDGQKVHTQIVSFQDVYAMLKKGDVYPCMGCRSFLTPDNEALAEGLCNKGNKAILFSHFIKAMLVHYHAQISFGIWIIHFHKDIKF